uniref:Cytochrome c oxidase subunit 3 n=1 Tax=Challia fletcheri TaxID=1091408 RepID=J7F0B4_9NEOP|nr:cytochrome c oxidase subunit III [Challia fletcheri]AEP83053.1 cytochrome oxidase subunit III [Challia fletcheri]
MIHANHSFHLVSVSPWPLAGALGVMVLVSGAVSWFHMYSFDLLFLGIIIIFMVMFQWWRDVIRESTFQGCHTLKVYQGLRWGMILFIISEVFFFVSFFWAFFHSSLSPVCELGGVWPPTGVHVFNAMQIPLLNTAVLLASGVTVTWGHHGVVEGNYSQSVQGVLLTVLLGAYFTVLQGYEYVEASFSIADSVYGSVFFVATGFHGLHVIIGSCFLLVCLVRILSNHFSSIHHFGIEAAIWYWHFVDVVWLFLYISIYWWGS